MATEHARAADWASAAAAREPSASEWSTTSDTLAAARLEMARTPVDDWLIEVAADLLPGKALDLGCGAGQDSLWLAQRGWTVTAVDPSADAIAEARDAAAAAGVAIVFRVADIAAWRPASRYDLVVLTFALPARGMGRSRALEMAASAVAPGGLILLTELDISLGSEGWMAEKHLVSREELERHLDGFRVNRSVTRVARHRHGYEERFLPVASVVATRRTDLRTL
ncbi:MAG TPA: class I SAM-dependent methyltransferase [Candidatus Limnocylindrales bacterium]|nr:class I SAM-dependent methyltransferase [Candidatus Limnocylindrales bacterium]